MAEEKVREERIEEERGDEVLITWIPSGVLAMPVPIGYAKTDIEMEEKVKKWLSENEEEEGRVLVYWADTVYEYYWDGKKLEYLESYPPD